MGISTTGTEGLVGAGPIWGPIRMGSDRRSLRAIRFAMMVRMRMKVARWSHTGLGAPRRSLRRERPRSMTMGGQSVSDPETRKDSIVTLNSSDIVRAVPKAETQQDVKSGVQKFRVKLLPESLGQNTMDVLCQVRR